MKQTIDKKAGNKDTVKSINFDEYWQSIFEELGKKDLPPYLKASYEIGNSYFKQRELFLQHLAKRLLLSMDPLEEKTPLCLDLGCNAGLYTQMLHQHNLNICGIDYAETLIREAKMTRPNIPFFRANAYDIPFKDNSFDSVVSFGLLQCVSDQRRVLQEMLRVLRPGGIGLIETNRDFKFPLIEKLTRHIKYLMTGEMSFLEVVDKFKARLKSSSSISTSCAPLKQATGDIVELLIDLDASEITVHNPTRLFFSPFFWGLAFRKKSKDDIPAGSTDVKYCPLCQSCGNWKLG